MNNMESVLSISSSCVFSIGFCQTYFRDSISCLTKDLEIKSSNTNQQRYCLQRIKNTVMRDLIVEDRSRVDGRTLEEMRSSVSSCGMLPRAHGSALFTRGETQALAVTTLGKPGAWVILWVDDTGWSTSWSILKKCLYCSLTRCGRVWSQKFVAVESLLHLEWSPYLMCMRLS